jgi:hypothetical protein
MLETTPKLPSEESADQVICRSEAHYAERPVALIWQGQRLEINEIVSRWRAPQGRHFLVKTQGNQLFELSYDEGKDIWQVRQP